MISIIKKYSSLITGIGGAVVILYGAFKFVDQGNDNARANQEIIKSFQDIQESQRAGIIRLDSIERSLRGVDARTQGIDKKMDKIRGQFAIHLSRDKSVTKEELLQILNDMDEKKRINWYDTIEPRITIRKIIK